MGEIKSEGKCFYCQKTFAKSGISRHLSGHLKKEPAVNQKRSFHLRIDLGPYFLDLLMDKSADLGNLDHFLRSIWLECCGHLSQFSYGRWNDEIAKSTKVGKIFEKGVKLDYAYDFGSTTELVIKVLGDYPLAVKDGILLLSRNEPFSEKCEKCNKKLATMICTAHWDGGECLFCEECAEDHEEECEEADYALMSIVNSPRMGVCGYNGGTIDLERDQVLQLT